MQTTFKILGDLSNVKVSGGNGRSTIEKLPSELSLSEIIEKREQIQTSIEELEAALKIYNDEIVIYLKKEGLNGTVVNNKTVSLRRLVTFPGITLEQANEYGAVETKQVVNTSILKALVVKGIEIPCTKVTEYPSVKEIERKEE